MQGSKIRLSDAEAALVSNAEIILTKNTIIQKTVALMAHLQEQMMMESLAQNLSSSPKISKGENYLGLPYVVLDYPRISTGGDLFFIRSMFWWGHLFSSTLQVAGRYREEAMPSLVQARETLAGQDYFIGVNEDPWQHHFEASNYRRLAELSRNEYVAQLQEQAHIKIAARWPLSQWDVAANHLFKSWKMLAGLVA